MLINLIDARNQVESFDAFHKGANGVTNLGTH